MYHWRILDEFADGTALIFGDLDIAAARNILHNLGTDFLGSLCYKLLLILNVFGVEDDAL